MDLDLRLLRSFVAIYECGTLSRAAEKLACTQAAMSMRLKLLETEMGELLFRRQHHRLEPTAAATDLYGHALKVLAAHEELLSATRRRKPRRKLRLGVPDDYALGILPRALERLGRDSGHDIEISCDLSARLAAQMQQHALDLALVTLPARPAEAAFEIMLPLNWVAKPGALPLPHEPVPLAAYPEGCVFRAAMLRALQEAGRPWHMRVESRTHAGIISAVKAGVAVTAMAKGTAPGGLDEVASGHGLPALPSAPVYVLGAASSPLARLLQEELSTIAGSIELSSAVASG